MSWLPRFSVQEWMACQADGEVEGYSITITWGSWEIEIGVGRHNGRCR